MLCSPQNASVYSKSHEYSFLVLTDKQGGSDGSDPAEHKNQTVHVAKIQSCNKTLQGFGKAKRSLGLSAGISALV